MKDTYEIFVTEESVFALHTRVSEKYIIDRLIEYETGKTTTVNRIDKTKGKWYDISY